MGRLRAAGCVAAEEEARELLAHAPDGATLDAWVARREQGEPLAWITGQTCFLGGHVRVEPGVYVPRVQTEELARRAAGALPRGGRAVDLCTGSGAIAAHLRATVPSAHVVGVDVDVRAAMCARRNAVPAIVADVRSVPLRSHVFDVVTAVPPYVPTNAMPLLAADVRRYEPAIAVDGGADGLAVARHVVATAARLLRPGGVLLLELGGEQDDALVPTLAAAGFPSAEPWHDDDGALRGVAAAARPM
ncbi:MAG TPA: HemK family protein methyltransferase [Acidimicrobiia bacterium]|nr:HemK family protein methyltransferase [Acidimicrobiia bacterium]